MYLKNVNVLIQEIHKIEGIKRIRLGSLEPKVVTEEFASELSKLETERSAITTEMESISKVRDENVERTFGIFS